MDKNIDLIIKTIKERNGNSSDIYARTFKIHNTKVSYIFLESVSSDDKISNYLNKSLGIDIRGKKSIFDNIFDNLKNTIPNSKLKVINNYDDIFYHLFSGFTCVFVEGFNKCITIETKASLDRSISESSSEPVLKGPKDSFNENFLSNIGLIRKRIKDENLIFTEVNIGRRSKTKVAISYIKDIADTRKVNLLLKRLKNIDIDGIIDSSYLKELIIEDKPSILPLIISTERPDNVAMSLLNGKIAIIVENTPYVLLVPSVFADFFKSPEDSYSKPFNASFTRIIRYLAFIIAILTPGIYIAVMNYNMEVLPNQLLISFAIQKEGVPFPTIVEVFIMIIAYSILREADTRKPQIMGASISIVGALILGEAAVSAGIISPIVVIIISLSAVSGMAFSDPDIINAIRAWRIIFMIFGCVFGLIGIFVGLIIFIAKLSSLEVLKTPYLEPIAPLKLKDWKQEILRFPTNKINKRPSYLTDKNNTKLEVKK
ncbi:MAG: spore germination protein [Firmicutes bacterium]|nr:spore germination protein [Bacillota bacterium]